MGTEVLRPHDCLIERIRVSPAVFQHHRRKNVGNGSGNPNPRVITRKPVVRPDQKKKNGRSQPLTPRRAASLDDLRKNHQNSNGNLVMGQVTILRRGESLDSTINGGGGRQLTAEKKTAAVDDLVLCGTERLGPDPEKIRIRDLKSVILSPARSPVAGERRDVYAGSAVSMSPSPRALPLPSFFSKKKAVDDSATRDLRRLLRLD
jgi:hypothetical protein